MTSSVKNSVRSLSTASLVFSLLVIAVAAAPAAPEAVTMVRPAYPAEAQKAGIQGCAILEFDVSAIGAPENIRVASSTPYPEFGDAARKALEQWRFAPSAATTTVRTATQAFVFSLPGKKPAPTCGGASAISAVIEDSALPPLPPPAPVASAPSRTASAVRPIAPPVPPATVTLNVTRPPVEATFETAAGFGPVPAGRVTVQFCVNTRGRTERVKVVKSEPRGTFDTTALRIIRAAEFKPYMVNGSAAVACGITQTIVFKPASPGG